MLATAAHGLPAPITQEGAMGCAQRLKNYLDSHGVAYAVIPHREAFTAQEVAHNAHVSGRMLAKVVVLHVDPGRYHLFILPAHERLALDSLRESTGFERVEIAGEEAIQRLFPDCERGAIPPFGSLYGLPSSLDSDLEGIDEIHFAAGNHHEVVRMKFADFKRVAGPFAAIGRFHERQRAAS
jgi:Ala-tRNA(Pro) deacylase